MGAFFFVIFFFLLKCLFYRDFITVGIEFIYKDKITLVIKTETLEEGIVKNKIYKSALWFYVFIILFIYDGITLYSVSVEYHVNKI